MQILQPAALLALCLFLACAASAEAETADAYQKRTRWWREARFGMFIHWGLYSVPADATGLDGGHAYAEWYQYNKQMQTAEYAKFAPRFNPTRYDPKAWVKAAKDAGMKYIILTTKHHEGFALWDTRLSTFSVTRASPYGRDLIRPLADECRKQGIRLGFYYSIMDWRHPDYLPRREWEKETRRADGADLNRYIDFMKGQIRELLTAYAPVAVMWFDGGWEHTPEELRSAEVVEMIRSIQPDILINDRIMLPEDYATPEQYVPAAGLPDGRLWETCMTMNNTWGYATNDHTWKSSAELVRNLCDAASKGGNYLLNVGPTADGEFTPETSERLADMGRWMKANGTAIYGTSKSPFQRASFHGRVTSKGDRLYLHVFQWPDEGLTLKGLKTTVRSAHVVDGGERLTLANGADGPTVSRPRRLDPFATVIEVRLAGAPEVEEVPVRAAEDGSFALQATDAHLDGSHLQVEAYGNVMNLGHWTEPKDTAAWSLEVLEAGDYRVALDYACEPSSAGASYRVEAGESRVNGTVEGTGGWAEFRTTTLEGALRLPAGRVAVRIVPESMPHGAVMNLRRITLTPVN